VFKFSDGKLSKMKPVVDYVVAASADPTPINLFTPSPNYEKYHTTWLEDKWFPFMGFVLGAGCFWYTNTLAGRPLHAGESSYGVI